MMHLAPWDKCNQAQQNRAFGNAENKGLWIMDYDQVLGSNNISHFIKTKKMHHNNS